MENTTLNKKNITLGKILVLVPGLLAFFTLLLAGIVDGVLYIPNAVKMATRIIGGKTSYVWDLIQEIQILVGDVSQLLSFAAVLGYVVSYGKKRMALWQGLFFGISGIAFLGISTQWVPLVMQIKNWMVIVGNSDYYLAFFLSGILLAAAAVASFAGGKGKKFAPAAILVSLAVGCMLLNQSNRTLGNAAHILDNLLSYFKDYRNFMYLVQIVLRISGDFLMGVTLLLVGVMPLTLARSTDQT